MAQYYCKQLFTGQRWLERVRLETDPRGFLTALEPNAEPEEAVHLDGVVLPGLPNLHSHAHQRAMAGLAERSGTGEDSFWTWRTLMYRHLEAMTPEDLEAIAAQLYVEMLEAGYTAVGEFQYLHHQADGSPYADPAEMTLRCLAAAREVGLGFCALPVYYAQGGFGAAPPSEGQRRFLCDRDLYTRLLESVAGAVRASPEGAASLGVAPHSLRAVSEADLHWLAEAESHRPVHLHIAEQVKEVEDCVAWSGSRPLTWLFDRFAVDARWCLIHGTHMDDAEVERAARSGAVLGLCPVTEANLGDGIFRAADFLGRGGRFGIGSDSHISVSPVEELRWLEYAQRLERLRRNVLAPGPDASTGEHLVTGALAGGAQAMGLPIGEIAPGRRADWLVLDDTHPLLAARRASEVLDSWIFSGNAPCIREVYTGGRRVVEAGRHEKRTAVAERFRRTLERLRKKA